MLRKHHNIFYIHVSLGIKYTNNNFDVAGTTIDACTIYRFELYFDTV